MCFCLGLSCGRFLPLWGVHPSELLDAGTRAEQECAVAGAWSGSDGLECTPWLGGFGVRTLALEAWGYLSNHEFGGKVRSWDIAMSVHWQCSRGSISLALASFSRRGDGFEQHRIILLSSLPTGHALLGGSKSDGWLLPCNRRGVFVGA